MPIELNENGLTHTQQLVADQYLSSPNEGKAKAYATALGCPIEVARRKAYKLWDIPKFEAYIEEQLAYLAELAEVSKQRIMRELAAVAFMDIRQLYDDEGQLLPVRDWPADVARAVSSLDEEVSFDKEGKVTNRVRKVRTAGKLQALDQLSKLLRLYDNTVEVRHGVLGELLSRASAAPLVPPGVAGGDGGPALEAEQPLLHQGQGREPHQVRDARGHVPLVPPDVVPEHPPEG